MLMMAAKVPDKDQDAMSMYFKPKLEESTVQVDKTPPRVDFNEKYGKHPSAKIFKDFPPSIITAAQHLFPNASEPTSRQLRFTPSNQPLSEFFVPTPNPLSIETPVGKVEDELAKLVSSDPMTLPGFSVLDPPTALTKIEVSDVGTQTENVDIVPVGTQTDEPQTKKKRWENQGQGSECRRRQSCLRTTRSLGGDRRRRRELNESPFC